MDYIVNKQTDGLKDIQTKQLGMKNIAGISQQNS